MSNLVQVMATDLTPEQVDLIKNTVAKNASNDELKLFLYRCKNMGLDPLKPGHIHFIKYGNNPGTIVIGIDGFRFKAMQTGKHMGTKRGVIRDDKGKCVGAWCEVYRADWSQPAREEVSLAEYSTGKNQWIKMPETMIKKVAEVAALRMAFPDELGGIYSDDEMAQTNHGSAKAAEIEGKLELTAPPVQYPDETEIPDEPRLGDYVRKAGKKHKGCTLSEMKHEEHVHFANWCNDMINKKEKLAQSVLDDFKATEAYLKELEEAP